MKIEDRESSVCDWVMERTPTGERDWYCVEHLRFQKENHSPFPYPYATELYNLRISTAVDEWVYKPEELMRLVRKIVENSYHQGQHEARQVRSEWDIKSTDQSAHN